MIPANATFAVTPPMVMVTGVVGRSGAGESLARWHVGSRRSEPDAVEDEGFAGFSRIAHQSRCQNGAGVFSRGPA
jgi:hypothetical protein